MSFQEVPSFRTGTTKFRTQTPHRSGGGKKSVAIHKQRDKVGFKKHTPRMKKNLKSAIFNGGFLRNLIFKDKNCVFFTNFLKNDLLNFELVSVISSFKVIIIQVNLLTLIAINFTEKFNYKIAHKFIHILILYIY